MDCWTEFIKHRRGCPASEMGRRRRKVLRSNRRTLPKVFACPRCGVVAVRITSQKDEASQDYITVVACGNAACKLRREFRFATEKPEIDVYNTFVDDFAKSGG
jgi:transcription elongation factor Elf1